MNRVHPSFGPGADTLEAPADSVLSALVDNLHQLNDVARREEATFAALVAELAPAPVGRVLLLGSDVHDVAGLRLVAEQLFATPAIADPPPRPPAAVG